MDWLELKAALLEAGIARLTGVPADRYISHSAAGPGAGGPGSVFFALGDRRVRLAIGSGGPVEIMHAGGGIAVLSAEGIHVTGRLEPADLHCPRQAYITVSGSCIFRCRYCPVPGIHGGRKTPGEIMHMIEQNRNEIDAISITSGVAESIEEEESCVAALVERLSVFGIPIGVSIYPTSRSPEMFHSLGVAEVKWNIEAATQEIFHQMCPGLDYSLIRTALACSVPLYGRGHVFSNVIVGLGETDAEMEDCIRNLAGMGVIPVLRPLNPVADLTGNSRPAKERLIRLFRVHASVLSNAGLDPCRARTMCSACTGCDLVPGRDA
jgi:biotin synthase-related radical SAM superfamily protein